MSQNAWSLGTAEVNTFIDAAEWNSVCYGNGKFVAVASTGAERVMVSSYAGFFWDPSIPNSVSTDVPPVVTSSAPPVQSWSSVCYGNGLYVAVSSDAKTDGAGSIMTSTDGLAWVPRIAPATNGGVWKSVCFGYSGTTGLFVAVGSATTQAKRIMTSLDGITWTFATATPPNLNYNSVAFGSGYFVAVGNGGIAYSTGTTGNNWTLVSLTGDWVSVCYGNPFILVNGVPTASPRFVAVSGSSSSVAVDLVGEPWTVHETSKTKLTKSHTSVCYGDGKFVAVSQVGGTGVNSTKYASTSTDASSNWTEIYTAAYTSWTSVCFGNMQYVAVAKSGTMVGTVTNRAMYTTNVAIDSAIAQTAWNENATTDNALNFANEAYCYLIGTKILCLIDNTETYIPIEDIRNGTLVKTYKHGYIPVKLIGKRNMVNNPKASQNCLFKMKDTGLSITGGHSILVDDLNDYLPFIYDFYAENHMIEDKYILLAGDSDLFEPFMDTNEYTLYHLCLESDSTNDHFGIWADGVLSESTSEKDYFDGLFENTG